MNMHQTKRFSGAAILAACAMMLSGCFILPGKFTSELVLKNGGDFAFTYDGEINFLGLSKLAQMGAGEETFSPMCEGEDEFPRECTEAETAEQRAEWDAAAPERALKAEKQAQQMAAMMGGIDPTDPEAAFKLEQLLLRHQGWNSVIHKGEGLYDVEYAIEGSLTHGMAFPVIEGFADNSTFVKTIIRKDNIVRVNAPGFAMPDENSPPSTGLLGGMMSGMAGLATAMASEGGESTDLMSSMPEIDGTFTIVTDGQILANNTDEGPAAQDGIQALSWAITPQRKTAPTALVKLAP
ncbi:MAG: hypothetical protein ABJP34_13645 [Erythrobacter sp.]